MATEFRQRQGAPERVESPDLTHSGARPRLGELSESARGHGSVTRSTRSARPSIRPSAFGAPQRNISDVVPRRVHDLPDSSSPPALRVRTASGALVATVGQADPSPPARATPPRGPTGSRTKPRAVESATKSIKTDIEELLPISQVKSLPRPPRVPTFDSQPPPPPRARRFPWASLSVFAMVLIASAVSLSHYRGLGEHERPSSARPRVTSKRGPEPQRMAALAETDTAAVARIERMFAGKPEQLYAALLESGDHALASQDERTAERLYARARELSGDSALAGDISRFDRSLAAHGLARVRLAQGDLEGAEGWLRSAIDEQPRNALYHAIYADVLTRQGRTSEAELERALARSLAHFSQKTRVR